MLTEIEKDLLKRVRFCNVSGNDYAIKGWLCYEIGEEVLHLSREERDAIHASQYIKFDRVFSSLLGKEVEAIRVNSEKLNLGIKKALEQDPELTWRELGLPAWYWRSEIK